MDSTHYSEVQITRLLIERCSVAMIWNNYIQIAQRQSVFDNRTIRFLSWFSLFISLSENTNLYVSVLC
jgi:hypothetical protein